MNRNDNQWEELLRATEHPEDYSNAELEELLQKGDHLQVYNLMTDAENACRQDEISDDLVAAEWQRIADADSTRRRRSLLRIAAVAIGMVMIAGIVYAAIVLPPKASIPSTTAKATALSPRKSVPRQETALDTVAQARPDVVEYQDVRLITIMRDIATYYHKDLIMAMPDQADIRIYLEWDRAESLESIVRKLNHFDKFSIEVVGNQIKVE